MNFYNYYAFSFRLFSIRQVAKRNLTENRLDDLPRKLIKRNKQQQQKHPEKSTLLPSMPLEKRRIRRSFSNSEYLVLCTNSGSQRLKSILIHGRQKKYKICPARKYVQLCVHTAHTHFTGQQMGEETLKPAVLLLGRHTSNWQGVFRTAALPLGLEAPKKDTPKTEHSHLRLASLASLPL